MTRAEHDRRKRQMNRRIREVLAVRRMMATDVMRRADAPLDIEPPPEPLG
jgi:hypothetical protein